MEADGLNDDEALGLLEALGLRLGEAEFDGDSDGLGERLALGEIEVEAEGDLLAEGENDVLAEGERERELDALAEAEGDKLALGEREALGEIDTEKLCIQISQFSRMEPTTFLYSNISPKTLPVGWGP